MESLANSIVIGMANGIDYESPVEVGFKFEKTIHLTAKEISNFATLSGDFNPMHHDPEIAGSSRFGGIIACGPQSSSLFIASASTHLAPGYLVIGMDFHGQFLAPVRPDIDLLLSWTVTSVEPKPKMKGYITVFDGGIYHRNETLMAGVGTCLVLKE